MKVISVLFMLVLAGCGNNQDAQNSVQANQADLSNWPEDGAPMEPVTGPAMLIVGDSISLGYIPFLTTSLQKVHARGNNRFSAYGVAYISHWVEHAPEWEVCTLNHGLWDAQFQVSNEAYLNNLGTELTELRTRCKKILFITTTNIPPNYESWLIRNAASYNDVVKPYMAAQGIPVCDVYGVSNKFITVNGALNYHFTDAGSQEIAAQISACLGAL